MPVSNSKTMKGVKKLHREHKNQCSFAEKKENRIKFLKEGRWIIGH